MVSVVNVAKDSKPVEGRSESDDHLLTRDSNRSFLIQVPLTLIGALNVLLFYPPGPPIHKTSLRTKLRNIDILGALLIIAAVGTLLVAFDLGSNTSWSSPLTFLTLFLSGGLFAGFVYVEAKVAKEPFCPKEVLRERGLAGCVWCGFASYGAWFGVLYYLPLYWQAVEGVGPKEGSVRLLPGVATGVVGSLFAGWVCYFPFAMLFVIFLLLLERRSWEGRGERGSWLIDGQIIQRTGRYYTLILTSYVAMTTGAILLVLFTGVVSTSLAATLVAFFICGMGLNIGGTSSLVALSMFILSFPSPFPFFAYHSSPTTHPPTDSFLGHGGSLQRH